MATLTWTVEQIPVVVTSGAPAAPGAVVFDPLGYGIACPFRRASNGDFAAAGGVALVRSDVGQLLGTQVGELPWRHEFGTHLDTLRHKANSLALGELARSDVDNAFRRWEPRVEVVAVAADPIRSGEENQLQVSVEYRIGEAAVTEGVAVAV